MSRILLIYIAGYGRSGSTVLDVALSAVCHESTGCGEVGMLPRVLLHKRQGCSCGEDYAVCPLWKTVVSESLRGDPAHRLKRLYAQDGLLGFIRKPSSDYIRFWGGLFKKRVDSASFDEKSSWVVIDSTKTVVFNATRPVNLTYLPNVDVVVIHLKRNLSGVMASRRKGRNFELATGRRTQGISYFVRRIFWRIIVPINWLLANGFAAIAKKNRRVMLSLNIDFADVQRDPEAVALQIFDEISSKLGVKLQFAPTTCGLGFPDHMVESNRLVYVKSGVVISGARRNT